MIICVVFFGVFVVDGGLGMGKIVVVLYCVVYFFYVELWLIWSVGGMFLVGLNVCYFVYVDDVLLSFGEDMVCLCILCDFVFEGVLVVEELDFCVVVFKVLFDFDVVFDVVVKVFE